MVQMARPQSARLGSIRPGAAGYGASADAGGQLIGLSPVVAWTTISDEAPDSSANFMSVVLQRQAAARQSTPGTLNYTPASDTPAANVTPWNSWLSPNCPLPGSVPATATDAATAASADNGMSKFWAVVGLLGAAASTVYLLRSVAGSDKERR